MYFKIRNVTQRIIKIIYNKISQKLKLLKIKVRNTYRIFKFYRPYYCVSI